MFNAGDTGISASSDPAFRNSKLKNNKLERINERQDWPITCNINCCQKHANCDALEFVIMGKI